MLGAIRHQPHASYTRFRPGPYLIVSDIEAARGDLVARGVEVSEVFHEGSPGAPISRSQPSGRPVARSKQLWFVRLIQRSGRQRMVVPGGHDAAAWPHRPGCDDFCIGERFGRAHFGVHRPPTASTRSGRARQTRTGPIGMPTTWCAKGPARSCRPRTGFRDDDGARIATGRLAWSAAAQRHRTSMEKGHDADRVASSGCCCRHRGRGGHCPRRCPPADPVRRAPSESAL